MIFVTLGTFEMKFTRILNQLEKLDLKDKVIIQSGHTHFKSNKYQVINFMGKEEFRYYLEKADIVICHGGVGSILEAINFKKRVIAIPRLIKYNEHVDNHQVEIVKKFIKEGYIIGTINEKKIGDLIEISKKFNFKEYNKSSQEFICKLDNYIENII